MGRWKNEKFLVMVLLVTMMTMLVACNSGPATGGDDTKPEGERQNGLQAV